MDENELSSEARRLARELGVDFMRARRHIIASFNRVNEIAKRQTNESIEYDRPNPCVRDEGYVSVPFSCRSNKNAPLRRCLNFAAGETAQSAWLAATMLTWFLQALADEVAHGNVVTIPGLGRFGPYLHVPKDGGRDAVYPRFVPARPFRQYVNGICHPSDTKNKTLESYRRSHHPSSRPDKQSSTPTVMYLWREHVAREAGFDVKKDL